MQKACITFFTCIIIFLSALGLTLSPQTQTQTQTEYLRIHIRADSNSAEAQNVKYAIKDKIVEFLAPYIAECDTKEKAEQMLNSKLGEIEAVADSVLLDFGFKYHSKASLKTEEFPTRVYEDLTLEQGFYKALIIELGSGKGDNWWCVVYPPLCFTKANCGYVYKSKIYEIIQKFFKNK